MWFERQKSAQVKMTLNTGGSVTDVIHFPSAVRILSYSALPQTNDQAAHATIVDVVTFTKKSAAGAGSTVLAKLTNDTDDADALAVKSSAWTTLVAKKLNTLARPGSPTPAQNVMDEIGEGESLLITLTGAGTTPAANVFTVGVEYVLSD